MFCSSAENTDLMNSRPACSASALMDVANYMQLMFVQMEMVLSVTFPRHRFNGRTFENCPHHSMPSRPNSWLGHRSSNLMTWTLTITKMCQNQAMHTKPSIGRFDL